MLRRSNLIILCVSTHSIICHSCLLTLLLVYLLSYCLFSFFPSCAACADSVVINLSVKGAKDIFDCMQRYLLKVIEFMNEKNKAENDGLVSRFPLFLTYVPSSYFQPSVRQCNFTNFPPVLFLFLNRFDDVESGDKVDDKLVFSPILHLGLLISFLFCFLSFASILSLDIVLICRCIYYDSRQG